MFVKRSMACSTRKYGVSGPGLLQRFLKLYPQLLPPTPTTTRESFVAMGSDGDSDGDNDGAQKRWDGNGQDEEEFLEESHREAMEEMRKEERRRVAEFFLGNIPEMLEEEQMLDAILEEVIRKRREIRYGYDYRLYEVQPLEEPDGWGGNTERLEAQAMEMRVGGYEGALEIIYILLKNQGYHYDTRRSGVRAFQKDRAKKCGLARRNMEMASVEATKLMEQWEVAKQTIRRLEKELVEAKGERGVIMQKMAELWEENLRLKMELQMALALKLNPEPTPAQTNADGDLEMKDWSPDEKFYPVTPPRAKTQSAQPPPTPRKPRPTKPIFPTKQASGDQGLAKASVILETALATNAPSARHPTANPDPRKASTPISFSPNQQGSDGKVWVKVSVIPEITPDTNAPSAQRPAANSVPRETSTKQDSGGKAPVKAPVIPETTPATKTPSAHHPTAKSAAKNTHATQRCSSYEVLAKAFIIHGIPCQRPIAATVRDVRRAGFNVTWARWLVGARRRLGKPRSSVVIYLDAEIPIYTEDGWLLVRGRRLPIEVYDFDRQWAPVW